MTDDADDERYYSTAQVADLLGVSSAFVILRIEDGELSPVLDIGTNIRKKYRVGATALARYKDRHVVKPTTPAE